MIRVMFHVGIIFRGLVQKDHFFRIFILDICFMDIFWTFFRSSVVKMVLFNTHFSH